MKTFIDLTAIHRRMAPKQKLTAIEEWHRIERKENLIAGIAVAVVWAIGLILFLLLTP